jgi:hypothetical protein
MYVIEKMMTVESIPGVVEGRKRKMMKGVSSSMI